MGTDSVILMKWTNEVNSFYWLCRFIDFHSVSQEKIVAQSFPHFYLSDEHIEKQSMEYRLQYKSMICFSKLLSWS